jgi:hypothetical protein
LAEKEYLIAEPQLFIGQVRGQSKIEIVCIEVFVDYHLQKFWPSRFIKQFFV